GNIDTTVIGGTTTDTIFAQSGEDTLYGNKGNDTIAPGLGDDTVDGGLGNDTISYSTLAVSNAGAGVTVDLIAQTATGSGNDTLISIENIIGSAFRDTLLGNNDVNIIHGGAGNDTIDAKAGNDTIFGEAGNDIIKSGFGNNTIDGGVGTNTVDYSDLTSTNGVEVRLLSPDAVSLGETWGDATSTTGVDRLTNIQNVIGSAYNDTFSGANNTSNTFNGRAGIDLVDYSNYKSNAINANLQEGWVIGQGTDTLINIESIKGTDLLVFGDTIIGSATVGNTIYGMAGNDTIKGVGGNNFLYAGSGNDLIYSGTGNDYIDGGSGTNTLSYEDVIAIGDSSTVGVTVHLWDANAQDTGKGGIDTLKDIQNLIGTSKNDTLSGNNAVNTLNGLGGNDTADYSFSNNAIVANLLNGTVDKGNSVADTIISIENLIGTAGDDSIIGSNVANILDGGAGNDYFVGNGGNNTIIGGSGSDVVDYSNASFGVNVSLNNTGTGTANIGSQADSLDGIENIIGSNYSDTLISTDTNNISNTFWGGIGNDTLDGGSGNDYLYGQSGDDKFIASSGIDFIDGGSDSEVYGDTIDFTNIAAKIVLTLAEDGNEARSYENGVISHRIYNIENIIASNLDSTLSGNSKNNTLIGGTGNDTLSGGAGTNYLDGGLGINTVNYSSASSSVTVDLSKNTVQEVYLEGATTVKDTLINIQNVIGSIHKDIITGNSASNSLFGGLGDDTLVGSAGNDTLDGGDGIDVASYENATDDLNIDLGSASVSINATYGTDTFISIEGAIGGSGNDTITGTTSSNVLIGGAGNDTLLPNGNNGSDELDYIDGGTGVDFVSFNFGDSTSVTLDLADSAIQNTGKGRVQIINVENVEGGTGADKLYGNSSDNVLEGNAGNDTLAGRAGNNTLDGGADFDTVDYSAVDSLNGLNVNLGLATQQVQNNGYVGKDTLISIEKIIATNNNDVIVGSSTNTSMMYELGAGNDTIWAGSGANIIYTSRMSESGTDYTTYSNTVFSGTGNDTVYGSSGNDTFVVAQNDTLGSAGDDTFNGISGINTIDYSLILDNDANEATGGINVTLNGSNPVAITLSGGNTNTIQNVSHIIGTANSDTLTGDNFNNILDGSAGNDTIFGMAGNNTLSGGSGNDSITGGIQVDTIYGGIGDDTIFSSSGNDTIYGGEGTDTFDLSGRTGKAFVNLAENRARLDTNNNDDFDIDDE
ncbi:MAG: calcium-binding protein, partial [Arcobacteraceae bacterium]